MGLSKTSSLAFRARPTGTVADERGDRNRPEEHRAFKRLNTG
jgi:hypothetical protein